MAELRAIPVILGTRTSSRVKALYLSAFPAHERFPYLPTLLNTCRSFVHLTAYYDGDDFVGFTYSLEGEDLVFLCFLAVEARHHSKGYGGQIIEKVRQRAGERPLLLSIEPMDETDAANYDQRLRRLAFYKRNGLTLSQHFYFEGKERYQLMSTDLSVNWQSLETLVKKGVCRLIPIRVE